MNLNFKEIEKRFATTTMFSWMIFISVCAIGGFYFGGGALLLILYEKGISYSSIILAFEIVSVLGKIMTILFVIWVLFIFLNYLLPKIKKKKGRKK